MSNKKAKELKKDILNNEYMCSSDSSDEYSFATNNKSDKIVSLKPSARLRLKLIQPIEQEEITHEKIIKFYTDFITICTSSDQY